MRIKIILIICGLSFLIPPLPALHAQTYRENASVTPVSVYQQMLDFAENSEFDKILQVGEQISGVFDAIKIKFSVDIGSMVQRAISTGDKEKVKAAVYTIIYYDIKDVFQATEEGVKQQLPLDKLKERLKLSYLDYLLVSPAAKKIDFGIDREIRKYFNELLTAELAKAVTGVTDVKMKEATAAIEESYKSVFGI